MGRCGLVGGWLSWMVRASDSLGTTYELNCQGDSSFKTMVGGILSLGCLAVTLTYLYQQSVSMIERTDFKITDVTDYPQGALVIDLVASQLLPVIVMLNRSINTPVPSAFQPSVATFVGELEYNFIDLSQGRAASQIVQFPVKNCQQLINKQPYRSVFEDPRFGALMGVVGACLEIPENQTLTIFGGRFDTNSSYFRLRAYPCSGPQCLPPDKLSSFLFATLNVRQFIKFTDFEDPVKRTFVAIENLNIFSGDIGFQTNYYYETTKLKDHTFLLSEPTNERTFSSLKDSTQIMTQRNGSQNTCTTAQIADRTCSHFFSLDFASSGVSHNVLRSYPDVLQVLSDVGGFKEIIFVIVGVFYCFYNELMKKKYLGLQLVSMKELLIFFDNEFVSPSQNKLPPPSEDKQRELFVPPKQDIQPHSDANKGGKSEHRSGNMVYPIKTLTPFATGDIVQNKHLEESSLTRKQIDLGEDLQPKELEQDHPNAESQKRTELLRQNLSADGLNVLTSAKNAEVLTKPNEKESSDEGKDFEFKDILNRGWTFNHFKKFLSLRSEIVGLLELNSDITQITKEMTCFGVLKEVLFTPYQLKLLPLVSIELHRKRLQQQRLSAEGTQSPTDPLVQNICSFVGESLKYRDALESLLESVEKRDHPNELSKVGQQSPGIHRSIDALSQIRLETDRFIMRNLPDFVAVHVKPSPTAYPEKEFPSKFELQEQFNQIPGNLAQFGKSVDQNKLGLLQVSGKSIELNINSAGNSKIEGLNHKPNLKVPQKVKLYSKIPGVSSRRPSHNLLQPNPVPE